MPNRPSAVPLRAPARHWRLVDALLAGLAVAAMLSALAGLLGAERGLVVEHGAVDGIPMTLRYAEGTEAAPLVVIGHGFAGSRQLMEPFAVTLARNGYLALSFDFPGHGANPNRLQGRIGEERRIEMLREALARVVAYGRGLPQADGRLALLGHSMAGDVAVRYATGSEELAGSGVDALVAVSPYLSQPPGDPRTAAAPHNLLFIYGEWEPDAILTQGREAVAAVAGGPASAIETAVTYGDFDDGSARRLVAAPAVEHIGVLYSEVSLSAALEWLDTAFERSASGWIDGRGPWLGLYFLGAVLLAWPLSRRLPRVAATPRGAGLGWRPLLSAALLPALLTPLLLRPLPTDFLPIAIGDYLALHFGVYGLLTALVGWVLGARRPRARAPDAVSWPAFALALAAVVAYQTLALALPTEAFVTKFLPAPHRIPVLLVLFCGTLAWSLADEWLTRGTGARRGGYALTKLSFLLSLMLAVALDLQSLFFLVIIIPAILILFVVYGLFSGWIYRRTGHPWVAAVANALAFAAAISVSFPIAD
jgi:dienelactone hydrolase